MITKTGCLMCFAYLVGASTRAGETTRVSVDSSGNQGNYGGNAPSISSDGRYVAFASFATNLVPGDTNLCFDIFVHDRTTGQTGRVSVDSNRNEGDASCESASISSGGRYAAFQSDATNLVPGDTNLRADVFVHDRTTGQTTRVSVDSNGNQANDRSLEPEISSDGRYVVFSSWATNLVPGDTNPHIDVFVHDRTTGQTTCASVDSNGNQGTNLSGNPSISSDGRYVAFYSHASNLVPGDTNTWPDVFVHDRTTGQTSLVSVDSSGNQANHGSQAPSISSNGRYIAFMSAASNLGPGDTNGTWDIYVHDRTTGQTAQASIGSSGNQGNGSSIYPSISSDGRYVAFESDAYDLVPGDTNLVPDVYIHDRTTGQTTRVSVGSSGNEGNNSSTLPSISSYGRCVAFDSLASNLVLGDTNAERDVFVHERPVGGLWSK